MYDSLSTVYVITNYNELTRTMRAMEKGRKELGLEIKSKEIKIYGDEANVENIDDRR